MVSVRVFHLRIEPGEPSLRVSHLTRRSLLLASALLGRCRVCGSPFDYLLSVRVCGAVMSLIAARGTTAKKGPWAKRERRPWTPTSFTSQAGETSSRCRIRKLEYVYVATVGSVGIMLSLLLVVVYHSQVKRFVSCSLLDPTRFLCLLLFGYCCHGFSPIDEFVSPAFAIRKSSLCSASSLLA